MIHIALILFIALGFSIVVTPLARQLAFRSGIISVPRSRDIHVSPVPLLGGVAIYSGFFIAFILFHVEGFIREGIAIMLGATLVAFVGLIDDRKGLPATVKMAAQLVSAVILIIAGIQVNLFQTQWLNWIVTVVWIVGIINATNFLDNMDGLSAGIAAIAGAFFILLATMNEPRQVLVSAMAAALLGACVGFLRYNLNPSSKIFMGDTGSLFLGFILATLGIKLRFLSNVPLVTWMVPFYVLAIPIFDTSLVVVARVRRGVNPFTTAGKDHLSHRLVALGMTNREAVFTCYLLAGSCGIVATFLTQATLEEAYLVAGVMTLAMVSGISWFEYRCPSGVKREQ